MSMADLLLDRHNPDVLTCIANLSNDEVFHPTRDGWRHARLGCRSLGEKP